MDVLRKVGNRREDALAAAREVFHDVGYQKASMREVAARAGMTQAALYYHFANKDDILATIIEEFSHDLVVTLTAAMAAPGSPRERLARTIAAQLDCVRFRRQELKILVEDLQHLSPKRREVVRRDQKAVFDLYRSAIAAMKQGGEAKPIDVTAAVFGILASINWLFHWYHEDGPLDFEEIRDSIVQFAFHGACGRPPAEAVEP